MDTNIAIDREKAWSRLAQRVVQVVNLGWWMERFVPLVVLFSFGGAVTILILRNQRVEAPAWVPLAIIGGVVLILAAIAWFAARSRFACLEDGFVRLEKELRLHNALSTARAGVGHWPDLPRGNHVTGGYQVRWSRFLVPVAFAALILTASMLIPVSEVTAGSSAPNEPLAWEEMESWLDELKEEDAVEKADLEQVREQIEQLREQPEEEWFSHSSMEASDTLKQQLAQSLRQLSKESATAQRSLDALTNYSSQLSDAAKNQLMAEYNEALKGMKSGKLSPNADLMNALKEVDMSKLSQMSQSQMQQMMDALKKCQGACSSCLGGMKMPAGWKMGADLFGENLLGAPNMRFPEGGRIKRGPGEAPISLADERTELDTVNPEGVNSTDYSRAAPGDTLAIGEGEHEIEEIRTGPVSAGAVRSEGEGGERIWRESLVPEERDVLKRYFK